MPSKHCTCQLFAALHCNTGLLHETQEVKLPAINCPGSQIKGSSAAQAGESCRFTARQLHNGLLVTQSRKYAPAVPPVTCCGSRGSFCLLNFFSFPFFFLKKVVSRLFFGCHCSTLRGLFPFSPLQIYSIHFWTALVWNISTQRVIFLLLLFLFFF